MYTYYLLNTDEDARNSSVYKRYKTPTREKNKVEKKNKDGALSGLQWSRKISLWKCYI